MSELDNSDVMSVIFQPDPSKNRVQYWLNAEKRKRVINRDEFIEFSRKVQPMITSSILEACMTYSFYLWDAVDNTVVKLTHKSSQEEVLNPIGLYFNSVLSGITPKSDQSSDRKPKSLEEYLVGFGFEPLDAKKLQNLDVRLRREAEPEVKKKVGFFRRRK